MAKIESVGGEGLGHDNVSKLGYQLTPLYFITRRTTALVDTFTMVKIESAGGEGLGRGDVSKLGYQLQGRS